jgi:hypothetical protein
MCIVILLLCSIQHNMPKGSKGSKGLAGTSPSQKDGSEKDPSSS